MSDSDVWFFWNRCASIKWYPRRPIKKKILRPTKRTVICSICGGDMISYGMVTSQMIDGYTDRGIHRWTCRSCRLKEIEDCRIHQRGDQRVESLIAIDKYKSELESCEKFGTCDILAAHHNVLIEDPERLTTDFLIGIICGTEKQERYLKNHKAISQ